MKRLAILLILVVSLSSCSLFKKTMTKTVTVTKFLYDSTLRVNVDGYKPLVDIKPITDTAKIISVTGTSIAYIDPINSKIVLSFIPNDFDVKIKIDATKTERKKDVVYARPFMKGLTIVFIFAACVFIWYAIYMLYRKIKNKL